MIPLLKSRRFIDEKWIFAGVLLINLVLICSLKFIPSMDGPAHLYNSNILGDLLTEDPSSFKELFEINSLYIPNWTGHFSLAVFMLVFPSWIAEKLLLCFYIAGLAISFRLLIKQLNPDNSALSIFIFPFIYSFLFHLGFYNYSISFVFFFFILFYWLKIRNNTSFIHFIILLALITLTYYTAVLTFLFLGLCMGLMELKQIPDREKLKRFMVLFFASLPGLILFAIFYSGTILHGNAERYSTAELIKWLNDVRPLIIYNYLKDEVLTEQIFHLLIIMMSISIFYRYLIRDRVIFRQADILILPAFIALILLFILPSGSFAGMMSDRLALMFFMLLLVVVVSQKYPRKIWYFAVPPLLLIHFMLLGFHYYPVLRELNRDAILIRGTAGFIPEGSIVLPVDMTENWLENHFSNYLGADRDLIILENYQASAGWFPVTWNRDKMPNILLGDRSSLKGISWHTNPDTPETRQIEFIFLYGNTDLINAPDYQELGMILENEFTLTCRSDNKYIRVYSKKER